ncbi:MAG: glutamate 5-kinase [Chloroflexota bacterium]
MSMEKARNIPYHIVVAKFGTSLLTGGANHLNPDIMARLVSQISALHHDGREIVIVTSGAVAAGRERLGITERIKGIPYKQMLAAVGQGRLMSIYEKLFDEHNIPVAQALLTKRDLMDRAGYLNTRNTLLALLERRVIPVVNENDVVAADEMHDMKFGDNDNLSAMVASLVEADLLMILTDIDGLYTADPHHDPDARLISVVESIDDDIERICSRTLSETGTGGMITKIEAAKLATSCGITVIIANGRTPDIITRLAEGEAIGTRFVPAASRLESRKRWMLSGLAIKGTLVIDEGAARALTEENRSLLPSGIRAVSGSFQQGDIVDIFDMKGTKLGSGITNYSSDDIEVIRGHHSGQIAGLLGYDYGAEVVHRNNLVVI